MAACAVSVRAEQAADAAGARPQNQERVWLAEQKAASEQKKIDELRKQIEEEREVDEIRRLQEQAGGIKRSAARLDWMYEGPAAAHEAAASTEEYLTGKKLEEKAENEVKKVRPAHRCPAAPRRAGSALTPRTRPAARG